MANSLAELVVNLTAETASFSRKMDSAASDLKRFGQTADSVMRGVKTIGATLGIAFSVDRIAEFGKRSLELMDRMNKLSQSTGVQVETLSAMAYAGRLAGTDLESLSRGLAKLSKNAYEAATQGGTSARAFKALGISVKDANGQMVPVEKLVVGIADKFSKMQDGTAKTALAMQLLGKSGAELIPFFNQGGERLAAMAEEARRVGYAFGKDAAEGAERLKDNLERLEMIATGFANQVMSELTKSLINYSEELTKAGQNDALAKMAEHTSRFVVGLAVAVDSAITGFRILANYADRMGNSKWATIPGFGPAIALAASSKNDAEIERLLYEFQKRRDAAIFPKPLAALPQAKGNAPGAVGTEGGKQIASQVASAKAEIDALLAQMAAENFNVAEKVRTDWQKSIDKIAESFRKFPQLARLPEVQASGGKDIMLFHARMQAETAARAAQLEQDIKLLQDATKAYEQVLKEIGGSDYPNIPNKPVSVPVLSNNPWTPYEVELDKLKRNTEEMGQLATDVWYQTRTAAEAYAFELERLNILLDNGKISQETYNRAVDQLKARLDRNTISMREFGYEIGQVAQNAVTHWTGWRDMVDQLTQALIKLAFQLLVVNKIQEAMEKSGKGGGLLGGIIGGLGGSWGALSFGGLHDYPGPAYAGTSYLIGTPEIFTPKTDGYITPLKGLKAGGDTVIHIDARGADAGVEARIMRAMSVYKNRAVQESVMAVEERRRRS